MRHFDRARRTYFIAFALLVCVQLGAAELQIVAPEKVGLKAERLADIVSLVENGIQNGNMPGCVICVGRQSKIAYLEAFGKKLLEGDGEVMTTDTIFDMASITKPVATATCVMKLVEEGQFRIDDKVVKYLPEFSPNGKDEITIRQLLIHQSGLIPDNALSDYEQGPEEAWKKVCQLKLVAEVGTAFKYSDVNFIVLAKLIERVAGKNVHEYSREKIFQPLGMHESGYVPVESLRIRAAPTEKRNDKWMRGEVHDPRAFELGGIAGHAGLFSTARDLAIYAQMMIDHGTLKAQYSGQTGDVNILSPRSVAVMTEANPVSNGFRGLGWDKQTSYSSNRGDLLTSAAFGHGGFTGTVLWIDPELDLFFIFLSNRVHPNGKGSVNHLAGQILNVVASSIVDAPTSVPSNLPTEKVLCGVDVIENDGVELLRGQRIGLITNHTGRSRSGKSTIQILSQAENVNLVAIFSPEHGIEGKLDVAKIANTADKSTGLEVFSLYGDTRRPTAEMLEKVDTLVFDIQDVGARFYTYVSTMGEAMIASAEHKKRFVILDRPNPIGGVKVVGPMLDAGKESFVGFHSLPVRHGMTTGELATLLKRELKLDLQLDIVKCQGWQRVQEWDQTNLLWINPSPNMRSLNQAQLYPGIGLLEMTNVSVGRGTDTPFEVIGAPWLDGSKLAKHLAARKIPGVTFVPIEFTPTSSKFEKQKCGGINLMVTDRAKLEPIRVGIELAYALRYLFPDEWETKNFNRLLGNDVTQRAVIDQIGIEKTLSTINLGVEDFLSRRKTCLLY